MSTLSQFLSTAGIAGASGYSGVAGATGTSGYSGYSGVSGPAGSPNPNASGLQSLTTVVTVSGATAPTAGQVLTATGSTAATWQAAGASGATLSNDISTNSSFYIGMSTSTSGAWLSAVVSNTKLYFNPSAGTLNATLFNSLSDATQKNNVRTIHNATNTVKKLEGVEFEWADNGKTSAGVIAQQIEPILPHLVETNEAGLKSVNYSGLFGYLIETVKELSERIRVLEGK